MKAKRVEIVIVALIGLAIIAATVYMDKTQTSALPAALLAAFLFLNTAFTLNREPIETLDPKLSDIIKEGQEHAFNTHTLRVALAVVIFCLGSFFGLAWWGAGIAYIVLIFSISIKKG